MPLTELAIRWCRQQEMVRSQPLHPNGKCCSVIFAKPKPLFSVHYDFSAYGSATRIRDARKSGMYSTNLIGKLSEQSELFWTP